jgi:hypothetical protein
MGRGKKKHRLTTHEALLEVQLASAVNIQKNAPLVKRRSSKDSMSRIFRRKRSKDNELNGFDNSQLSDERPPPLIRRRSSGRTQSIMGIKTRKSEGGHLSAGRGFLHSKCETNRLMDSHIPSPVTDLNSPRTATKVRNKMMVYLELSTNTKRQVFVDLLMAGTSLLCFAVAAQSEQHLWLNQNKPDDIVDGLKSIVFLCSCAMAAGVVYQTHLSVEEDKLRNRILPEVTLWTSGRILNMSLQAAFNFLHAPPGTHR